MGTGTRGRWRFVAPALGLVAGPVAAVALRSPGVAPPAIRPAAAVGAPVPGAVAGGAAGSALDAVARGTATPVLPGGAIRAAVERWLAAEPGIAGVTVGVVRPSSGARWTAALAGSGAAVPADTAHPALSVTKTFVAALVLREARAGRLDLDAPVPVVAGVAPSPVAARLTPRMLLRHTSGLVDYHFARGYDPAAPLTPARAVSLALASPLLGEPGRVARYSNTNYHWLGLVLEHVTGRPLASLVADLTAAAGLERTALAVPDRPGWTGFGSGGVSSTTTDLTRWLAALLVPGRVLHPDDLRLLLEIGPWGASHGLWPVCPCAGTTSQGVAQLVADGGVVVFPAADLAVVVHLAAGGPRAHQLATAVATAVRDGLAAPARG